MILSTREKGIFGRLAFLHKMSRPSFVLEADYTDYPRLVVMEQTPQDPEWHPEGNVLQHTFHTMDEMAFICQRDRVQDDVRQYRIWGAFCHDMGKPECTMFDEQKQRTISPGHDTNLKPIKRFLTSVGINPDSLLGVRVLGLVKLHMRHLSFKYNGISEKSVRKLGGQLKEHYLTWDDWLAIVEADVSGRPPLPKHIPEVAQAVYDLGITLKEMPAPKKGLVTGQLLKELGYKPSPLFSEIIKTAKLQDLLDKESAVDWVLNNYPK